jgi:hypothetical protein
MLPMAVLRCWRAPRVHHHSGKEPEACCGGGAALLITTFTSPAARQSVKLPEASV